MSEAAIEAAISAVARELWVLIVVEDVECNICDQKIIEYEL